MSEIRAKLSENNTAINARGDSVIVVKTPEYAGPYAVTPTEEQQTLPTTGKKMTADLTVERIPEEYIFPQGTYRTEQNGLFNITQYADVDVDVPTGVDGNEMKYGISSCQIGLATIGTGYVWTDYSGGNIGIIGEAVVGTSVTV